MQIWLGKQYLSQKDKQELEQYGRDGGPIQVEEVSATTEELKTRLKRLAARAS